MQRPSSVPPAAGVRMLGLLIVVAGLFGMHGLASHGVQGMDGLPGMTLTSQSMASSVLGLDSAGVGADGQAAFTIDRPESPRASDSGHGGMDMSLGMMCVAILGVALLALLRFLRPERIFSIFRTRRGTRVISRPGWRRAPPSLIALSIQRC